MNAKTNCKIPTSLDASEMLPLGLSVECLKRMRSMSTRFSDIGFPESLENKLQETIISFKKQDSILNGDVKISC